MPESTTNKSFTKEYKFKVLVKQACTLYKEYKQDKISEINNLLDKALSRRLFILNA